MSRKKFELRRRDFLRAGALALACAKAAWSATPATTTALPASASGPPPIQDNSFLVEEAYNQEARVVQHIFTWTRFDPTGDYVYSFTQEWPFFSQRHQLSYMVPLLSQSGTGSRVDGVGDVELNYRYQWPGLGERVALAPRFTLRLPTGDDAKGLGTGAAGAQINLPLSYVLAPRFVSHTNAGMTYTGEAGDAPSRLGFNLGQSLVWLVRLSFNPMLELVWSRSAATSGAEDVDESFLLSPGFRFALNFRNGLQIVPGFAYPVGLGVQRGDSEVLAYLSFEHGF